MNYMVKQHVFGNTRCWMYSIEWQKRGLRHAHILIWLVERIRPDQIDDIICAEIPAPETDPDLHDVVTTNMIHRPCGTINRQSPCMVDGKCSKRYPRKLTAETITGNDGHPLYRRRSPDDNGRTITTKVKGNDFVVDNSWIVPYSPLLSKHSRHIVMLSIAIRSSQLNTFANMSRKGVTWRFLVSKHPISTMKSRAIKLVDMLTAMKQFGVYFHSLFTNVIPLLYIWRCI